MSYEKAISRSCPGLILLVLDDSGSMGDKLPGTSDQKYRWVEIDVGHILELLLSRSTDMSGSKVVVKPRYYLGVLVYGSRVSTWGEGIMDIQTTLNLYAQASQSFGLGGKAGGTDAKGAMEKTLECLQQALSSGRYDESFPPMVFHLTDGLSHNDPTPVADQIRQLSTNDGNVLIVNAYIGTQTALSYTGPEDFPGYVDVAEVGPSKDNIRLFNMSSQIPQAIEDNLKADGIFPAIRSGSRLFFDVRTKQMLQHVIQVVSSLGSRTEK